MGDDTGQELAGQIGRLLEQATDGEAGPLPRIRASIAVNPYLEALTRQLVGDARDRGHSWDELAEVFSTTSANVRQRYGSLRQYDDD